MNSAAGQPAPTGRPEIPAARACANCGTILTGPFCSECGQRHHTHPAHSLRHFIGEATEDLTHADSRLWQTLYALLLRPGFLTEEFLAGRRARYLPPVRLYLVVSIIFFLLVGLQSWLSPPPIRVQNSHGLFRYDVNAGSAGSGRIDRNPVTATRHAVAAPAAPTTVPMQSACKAVAARSLRLGAWCTDLSPRIQRSWTALNTEGGIERLDAIWLDSIERAMFLFLPLMALCLKPLYRNPRRYYVEHLLFLVYNQTSIFVLLGLFTLLGMITSSGLVLGPVGDALSIYVLVYFYLAMRRVYREGRGRTLAKLAVISLGYLTAFALMFLVIATYGFLTL
jgi:hypothetical protein